jgi:AcrR family transcriptional regulator
MKRIKQINESKNLILEAMYKLLLTFDLDAVTMTQIAREADVVRMTLYRHFKTKEDILLYGFELSMKKLASAMDKLKILPN